MDDFEGDLLAATKDLKDVMTAVDLVCTVGD